MARVSRDDGSGPARRRSSLARRLLLGRTTEDTVLRLLASALAVYTVGCIVPTPLEAETAPPNHAPKIIAGFPDFVGMTPYSPESAKNAWAFSVTAVDLDVGDTLQAHLYLLAGNDLAVQNQTTLTPTASDPTVRTGEFAQAAFCADRNSGQSYYFYVYVSDRPFPADDNPKELKQADSDFRVWVVLCP
jgi:hypothetical protein